MDRNKFLRKSLLGAAGITASASGLQAAAGDTPRSTYDKLMERIGFNHLPNSEMKTAKTILHKADTRGTADHGWLYSRHTFSFANYYQPERMHFGVLRVLNDDYVAPGRGFGTHPHDNMEIVSIPLDGDLEHKDSMGNTAVIREGDVQVMSAGTGIFHSEYNQSTDKPVKFLQIWVFPNRKGVKPRYDQITLKPEAMQNHLHQILSPDAQDDGVWVHQDAWFHMGRFDAGRGETYQIRRPGNGVYVFVLAGTIRVGEQVLEARDGLGIWDTDSFAFTADADAKVLLMDVPMSLG